MFDLVHAFKIVRRPMETALFLQDLLTATEIRNLSVRLRIAKLLLANKSFIDIQRELHVSSATVNKVSNWINQGGDGLRNVITKLPIRYAMPKRLPPGPIEYHLPQALVAITQAGLVIRRDKQIKKMGSFVDNLEGKKRLDKELQEQADEYYRETYKAKKKKPF